MLFLSYGFGGASGEAGGRRGLAAVTAMANLPTSCDVLLLNDNDTPMDFVVTVLEDFFGMRHDEAVTHMLVIHNGGSAICGTYRRDEAEKKVADVLAFAAKHKHPLQCVLQHIDPERR